MLRQTHQSDAVALGRRAPCVHLNVCLAACLTPAAAATRPPPQGTLLPGPLQKEAAVRLAASCSTLLGGAAQPPTADFASLADATDALPQVAGQACRQAADAYASAMRLQVRLLSVLLRLESRAVA